MNITSAANLKRTKAGASSLLAHWISSAIRLSEEEVIIPQHRSYFTPLSELISSIIDCNKLVDSVFIHSSTMPRQCAALVGTWRLVQSFGPPRWIFYSSTGSSLIDMGLVG